MSKTSAFNPDAPCSPTLTQCPRCNNPHHACDGGKTSMPTIPDIELNMVVSRVAPATHQHLKTEGFYRKIAVATAQAAKPVKDGDLLTVYAGQDGRWWARPPAEFEDRARFSYVFASPQYTPGFSPQTSLQPRQVVVTGEDIATLRWAAHVFGQAQLREADAAFELALMGLKRTTSKIENNF